MNKRKLLKLTQRQVANVVGVTDQAVSDWERGVSAPRLTVKQWSDLCDLFRVTKEELVTMFEEVQP